MEPIADFLKEYKKPSSIGNRSVAVRRFFAYLYPKRVSVPGYGGGNINLSEYEPVAAEYLALVRNGEEGKKRLRDDLKGFVGSLLAYSPNALHGYLQGVYAFFDHHGIEVSLKERKKIRSQAPPNVAIGEDDVLTREKLAAILNHSPIQMKALLLVLSSSGCRLNEVLNLTLDRVDLDASPATLKIPKEFSKNKLPRTAYISSEAAKVLREWLKYRVDYIEKKKGPRRYRTTPKDARLFPFVDITAEQMFTLALEKAGLHHVDPNTGKATLSLHDCRKFFRTNMAKAGENALDIVERLMGHKGAYLSGSYVRVEKEEIEEFYRKNEHLVFIYPGVSDEDREKVKNLAEENARLTERLAALEKAQKERESAEDEIRADPRYQKMFEMLKKDLEKAKT